MPLFRRLTPALTLIKSYRFESTCSYHHHYRHSAIIGVGGNVGDVMRRFYKLKRYINAQKGMALVKVSPILKNPPFGYCDQEDFYNLVIKIKTSLGAKELMRFLLRCEKHFRRKRSFKDAPRTLDLDMIFFDNLVMKSDFLTLPHPHYRERLSVTMPLKAIKEYR